MTFDIKIKTQSMITIELDKNNNRCYKSFFVFLIVLMRKTFYYNLKVQIEFNIFLRSK